MAKISKRDLAAWGTTLVSIALLVLFRFPQPAKKEVRSASLTDVLTDSISRIASACPGEVGVAVIINNRDTVAVNNKSVYPMMSVFKLHQALAICHRFDQEGVSLDTLLTFRREALDPNTWSPMLKEHPEASITLPVKALLRYTLIQSDNNASNLMFERLVNAAETDRFIATLIPRSKSEMAADHAKAYANYTSPLGAAMLMNRLFTDSLVSREKQRFIMQSLNECTTRQVPVTSTTAFLLPITMWPTSPCPTAYATRWQSLSKTSKEMNHKLHKWRHISPPWYIRY